MFYDNKIWIGDADGEKVCIEPKMANRHGLIAGATGTGKTITLKVLAESFSDEGVPVFLADIKGDLSGMCRPGADSEDMQKRINKFGLDRCGFSYQAYPSVFWDIYGKMGVPARTTISEMGPVLLAKLMDLNDTQADILTVVFKIADDRNLLLIDTKDLKSMLQYVAEHNDEFSIEYGNISKQSVAAILRNVVALEAQGGEDFFAEPALNLSDWFFGGSGGKGPINILDCRQLVHDTTLYSTFLLWLLSELFETLPEVGDMDKPRMVFFFDEAHLLFKDISKALRNKIEQVVKLIRSKGVGVYFITQSPKDIPDEILGQLGNKIQHALRAYTPAEEKATRAVAASFRTNPEFDTYEVLTNLGTGEAIMSVLDEKGVPGIVKKCKVLPPRSLMGPISDEEKQKEIMMNNLYLKYQQGVDRDSAYEFFQRMAKEEDLRKDQDAQAAAAAKEQAAADKEEEKARQAEERKRQKEEERAEREAKNRRKQVASSAAGTIGRELGNMVGKSIGGSFGKKLGGNVGASLARNIMGTFIK